MRLKNWEVEPLRHLAKVPQVFPVIAHLLRTAYLIRKKLFLLTNIRRPRYLGESFDCDENSETFGTNGAFHRHLTNSKFIFYQKEENSIFDSLFSVEESAMSQIVYFIRVLFKLRLVMFSAPLPMSSQCENAFCKISLTSSEMFFLSKS